MDFTKWLRSELPHLENASSVVTFKLIHGAKRDTRLLRFLSSVLFSVVLILLVFSLSDMHLPLDSFGNYCVLAVIVIFLVLGLRRIENAFEQWLICRKIKQLAKPSLK